MLSGVETALLEKFGDLEAVWASAELQASFLELPLKLVEVSLFQNCCCPLSSGLLEHACDESGFVFESGIVFDLTCNIVSQKMPL